jgi:hypothetical protein
LENDWYFVEHHDEASIAEQTTWNRKNKGQCGMHTHTRMCLAFSNPATTDKNQSGCSLRVRWRLPIIFGTLMFDDPNLIVYVNWVWTKFHNVKIIYYSIWEYNLQNEYKSTYKCIHHKMIISTNSVLLQKMEPAYN